MYKRQGKPGVRTLRCFEAPIDMMSFQQIYPQDETHKLALCGVDCTALGQTLKDHTEILEVILCLDNDKAGKKAANELRQSLEERGLLVKCEFPPMGKDWNEALEAIVPKKAAYKASGDALER